MTAPWLCQSYPATQCAAVRIFVGATTAPPQKKPVSSEVSAVPLSSPYQSCAIQGAEVMVVVVPPMIFASAVCPVLPALYDDLAGRRAGRVVPGDRGGQQALQLGGRR
ncbi:hypothetical protein SGLAM104S_06034 [Streptomyces glaucescens]